MKTVTEQLREMAEQIKATATDLLLRHSGVERDWDANNPDSELIFISASGDHDWKPLAQGGRRLQSRIRDEYDRLLAILRTLLKSQPKSVEHALSEHACVIYDVINQEGLTWIKTVEEAKGKFQDAIDRQIALLSSLYDTVEGRTLFVPDTNALVHNPQLEDWEFDGVPDFALILTPTVLSELDQLKVNHRNDNVRQKAEGLIRRIKGYRARGHLADGVPLRKGRSTLMTIAIEPKMDESLPWLDADNNDDRVLAGVVEVMREHPRCQVILVTRDMNLQNKAEYAGLPFVEPPDPPATPPMGSCP